MRTQEFPAIREKAEWAMKWISSDRPFAERLVAFACIEARFVARNDLFVKPL